MCMDKTVKTNGGKSFLLDWNVEFRQIDRPTASTHKSPSTCYVRQRFLNEHGPTQTPVVTMLPFCFCSILADR